MLFMQWMLFLILWIAFYQVLSFALGSSILIRSRVAQLHSTIKSENDVEAAVGSMYQRVGKPITVKIGRKLAAITPMKWKANIQIQLRHAGNPFGLTVNEWIVWNLCIVTCFVGLAMVLIPYLPGLSKLTVGGAIIFLGLFIPHFYLQRLITKRQNLIRRGLPDLLDLLTVSVEAGLGFDQAMGKVVEKTSGPLAEEFQTTLQEVQMGKTRREALRDLGLRTGVEGVMNFTNALIQADKLGVSLGNVLRVQSEDMRQKRRQEAEEKAMKAPIKLLFPLIFFIFPSLFIIILGPAAINIMGVFIK